MVKANGRIRETERGKGPTHWDVNQTGPWGQVWAITQLGGRESENGRN